MSGTYFQISTLPFDALQWIGERSPSPKRFLSKDVQPLLHFGVMWNIFEGQLCDYSANVGKLRKVAVMLANKGFATSLQANDFLEFIRKRYYRYGRVTKEFYSLNLRSEGERNAVQAVVSGGINDPIDTIYAQPRDISISEQHFSWN